MNPRPIETAQDDDLRMSYQAMQRAAVRAWEIAARTGTAIIIRRAGVIEAVRPPEASCRPVRAGCRPGRRSRREAEAWCREPASGQELASGQGRRAAAAVRIPGR